MSQRTSLLKTVAAVVALSLCATPALADPGNGHGKGNGNHGNSNHSSNSNKGNSQQWDKGQDKDHGSSSRKNYGKPDHVDRDISYATARQLAVNYGLTGYKSLPPGIAKNLARGKPLPPGIAKKTVPGSMLNQLPYYPGYEWQVIGDNLVLIALSTAIVTSVINGVFD
ncbi:MAG: anti-virulence regulator CigR family protein [Kluyvera sp.]|uniref:anti-virulence regulator CigR family protein n=1 Tax=Kluyvera sp. TaxID=1538228 RepID=UPI003A8B884B